ncbi:MAG: 4Fe-4S binding protein, partial [Anaerovoracaceae bacterium]
YTKVSDYDPWGIFAKFRALDFSMSGKTAGLIVLIAIIIGMACVRRFFCLFLCPMGAVFTLIPVLPAFRMKRDPARCVGRCHQCEKNCPAGYFCSVELAEGRAAEPGNASGPLKAAGPDVPEDSGGQLCRRNTGSGECIACYRCAGGCPVSNAGPGCMKKHRGNEWYFIVGEAALLFAAAKLVIRFIH